MQQQGKYTKSYAPKSSEAAPRMSNAGADKKRPSKRLSVKAKDSKEYQDLTGLFENSMKNGGTYFTGTSREDKTRYYVFSMKNPKTGEIEHTLKYKDGEKLVKIATLKAVKSKAGNSLLVGENGTGDSFYVQDSKSN